MSKIDSLGADLEAVYYRTKELQSGGRRLFPDKTNEGIHSPYEFHFPDNKSVTIRVLPPDRPSLGLVSIAFRPTFVESMLFDWGRDASFGLKLFIDPRTGSPKDFVEQSFLQTTEGPIRRSRELEGYKGSKRLVRRLNGLLHQQPAQVTTIAIPREAELLHRIFGMPSEAFRATRPAIFNI